MYEEKFANLETELKLLGNEMNEAYDEYDRCLQAFEKCLREIAELKKCPTEAGHSPGPD